MPQLRKLFPPGPGESWTAGFLRHQIFEKKSNEVPESLTQTLYDWLPKTAARLMKGLFRIALQKKLARVPAECLRWSIMLEKRIRENASFARQFAAPLDCERPETEGDYLCEEVLKLMETHPENFPLKEVISDQDRSALLRSFGSVGYVRFAYL